MPARWSTRWSVVRFAHRSSTYEERCSNRLDQRLDWSRWGRGVVSQDKSIDACCVITPDMLGLTGGFDSAGTGAEGTVAGAHVINSTQQMSRSIADVYAVRQDWYNANKETVKKFVAGYLAATNQTVACAKILKKPRNSAPNIASCCY